MKSIVDDFKKVAIAIQPYVDLAGGSGNGEPEINYNKICFNGCEKCGHPKEDHGIAWPSDDAGGVANPFKENVEKGSWFGGVELQKRTCGGNCSHETMLFERIKTLEKWDEPKENGLYFEFCKTAFKPYDLAVIALLIIAKHYLKDKVRVSSDGTDEQWFDGKMLCQQELGYGLDFNLKIQELIDERNNCRKSKDFKRADEIKNELEKQGIIIEDSKDETIYYRRNKI